MTVEEELTILEDHLRRLKVEYDVYFAGGLKRPPVETEWRVTRIIKKFSDGSGMNYAQRFRYNTIAQRYAIFSDLWRQKMKIKEEGYRRPQDALLAIQGLRKEQEMEAAKALEHVYDEARPFRVRCSDPGAEQETVRALYSAYVETRTQTGEAGTVGSFESFQKFVEKKTAQLREDYGCAAVEYSVEVEEGHVRLKARAKQ